MARDYKNHSRKAPAKSPTTPGWAWLLAGLGIGLGVALGVHLHHTQTANMQRVIADSIAPDPSPADADAIERRRPRFEFYETLPNAMQDIVTEQEVIARTTGAKRATTRSGTQYFIQAGAFRQANEADRLRAELALLGLEAEIQKSKKWHRVRLGPYRDLTRLSADKSRLPSAKEVLVYEIKI